MIGQKYWVLLIMLAKCNGTSKCTARNLPPARFQLESCLTIEGFPLRNNSSLSINLKGIVHPKILSLITHLKIINYPLPMEVTMKHPLVSDARILLKSVQRHK